MKSRYRISVGRWRWSLQHHVALPSDRLDAQILLMPNILHEVPGSTALIYVSFFSW